MKKILISMVLVFLAMSITGCNDSQEKRDQAAAQNQQSQYAIAQPVPAYDWSLERDLLIKLYNLRNDKVSTHSVWRSDYGMVEGDCTSIGYGLPYDTSLTNPLQRLYGGNGGSVTVGQAEPNGVFASTNTAATWVMCVGSAGSIEPHYVEAKVTVFPYPVEVNYKTNRVTKNGTATATIQ